MLSAVIFDFDGIIVDTEPLHYKAFQDILVPLGLGYSWEEYVRVYIGFDDRDAFRRVFSGAGISLDDGRLNKLIAEKGEAFQQTISSRLEPYPGVVPLIGSISGKLPLALCSGALPSDIHPILNQLGIDRAFDVIVTAADVKASKPDPESYVLAVDRLRTVFSEKGIIAGNCLAIEDTPAGIASASRAGLKVVAVTNSYPEENLGGACKVVRSLVGIDLEGLRLLF